MFEISKNARRLLESEKKQYKDEGYISGLPVFSEKAKEDLHNFFLSLSTRLDESVDLNFQINNHLKKFETGNKLESYKELEQISKLTAGVRRLGAASLDLAYVSSGKLDGFWEKDLNLWDVSAGVLLIKEAGGRITEPQGNNWTTKSRDILVSNTLIHERLLENLTLL